MPTSKIEKFGRNLGFGIKPGVQRFGVAGQFHLAKAIVEPSNALYKGLNVPRSPQMHREATAFLSHNTQLHSGTEAVFKKRMVGDIAKFSFNTFQHHTLINKAYQDPLRYKAIYGRQKYIDPESRRVIEEYKQTIRYTHSYKEKKKLREKLREFEKKVSRPRWEVEAERNDVIPTKDPTTVTRVIKSESSFIKRHNIDYIKMQSAKLNALNENMWEKQFDGEDPGEAIGRGRDMEHVKSDLMRLVNYLKRARWIKMSVGKAIMEPKNSYVRAFLRHHLGSRKFREYFLSYNAANKYATNAYFAPGSEYGAMKQTYNNRKGELTPLQRKRTFDKGGKEVIKKGKD